MKKPETTENREKSQRPENINLRSDEVKEILGKPPGWLVRWGTSILFIVIIIVLTGSGFFSYPDLVRAPVIITKENPPAILIARSPGKAEAIFHPDGARVNKSDTLAVIENPARYNDIFRLGNFIRLLNQSLFSDADLSKLSIPGDMVLGEVQPAFNDFTTSFYDYRIFISQDFYEKKISALTGELNEYINYRKNLERHGYLNFDMVSRILQEHMSGRQIHDTLIWSMLIFQKWYDLYIDKR